LLLFGSVLGCAEGPPPQDDGAGRTVQPQGADTTTQRIEISDDAGRTFQLGTPPTRIVSLVPSATSTLLALGQGGALVGRTDFDTAASLADLPSVGGGIGPSIEVLVSLRPDLVIRFGGDTDPDTPNRLDDLGIDHFAVRPSRVADVLRIIDRLGGLTGHGSEADQLLSEIDMQLADVTDRVRGLPRIRVAFLLDGTPPWAAGATSYIGQLVELGGGTNVFADLDREYAPVSPEELLARDIQVVLTVAGATPGGIPDHAEVRTVSARTQLPGPDLGQAAEEIARAIHPEAFR
jgi:ABC-type Fe3+-hydroxamate transport system substrate-binding protein